VAIIASYHSDHASLANKVFNHNPSTFIFIEKPPAVTLEDLSKLIELYNKGAKIEIGFNRRFINHSKYVKQQVQNRVVIITCSIKEVNINPNHWYLWKNQGTRITGNCVHWFDLANFWIGSMPVEVNLISNPKDSESCAISVLYSNGSILNITASDKGNSLRGVQETIEIRYENETIFIDDFLSLTHIKSNGFKARKLNFFRDKGHHSMYKNFMKIINNEKSSEYSVIDLINTTVVTFYASLMLEKNIRTQHIENEVKKYANSIKNSPDKISSI
jgi:predicted dehydrogenase